MKNRLIIIGCFFIKYVRKQFLFIALTVLLFGACQKNEVKTCSQYVDPFVGTTFTGHTFPNATYPFGFMQPGPQTGNFEWKYCGGYRYEDSTIRGFSQNRLNGTGIPDLGDLLMMPFSGQPGDDYKSRFSHETEKASPGYYAVSLVDNSVDVELTATPHVAIHRYTFQEDNPCLYINFQSAQVGDEEQYNTRVSFADVNVEDPQTISGHHTVWGWANPRQIFYVIQFDQPFISKEEITKDERNKAPIAVFRFDGKSKAVLHVKVAISTVSIEGAKQKIEAELADWDFDRVKLSAENAWENLLSRIKIEGTVDQKKNFYTSLYHAFIQPHDIADLDGKYRGPNDSVLVSPIGKYYSTFSLWDTFRAAHPLYTLIAPEQESDFVNSMLLHAENYGILPIWALWGKETYCMIGNHGVPPVVEACLRDLPGIDQEKAYQWVKQSLTGYNRKYDWAMYDQYGYFPFDLVPEESVSRTLECGYDDYCAAQLAKKLNKTDDYAFFMKRAAYYKNLFDPETKLVRGKDSHGQWRTPFDTFALSHAGTAGGDYTEGNAWQYTWHVPQDVDGLVELLGGKEAFVTKLDSLFVLEDRAESTGFTGDVTGLIGQYAQGNEPSHHVVYLYSLVGRNDRTAELVREIFDRFYQPKPDGLCGNDDCGQMSAWYIFSALGFYPVNTVNGEYVLGAPQIPQATIHLPNNKDFTVIAKNVSEKNKYVKKVTLNGEILIHPVITYNQIREGGTLEFEMTSIPAVFSQHDSTDSDYQYVDFNHGQTTGNEEWIQSIQIIQPACRTEVQGIFTVQFKAPEMTEAKAFCWSQPTKKNPDPWGYDVNLTPKGIELGKDATGSFKLDANQFPSGPMTVRIYACNKAGKKDFFELQLYNKGGVQWNKGIPELDPPGAKGLKLVFSDDFDGPLSISNDGRNARYNAHKPCFGDFSGWQFADADGPDNPFEQIDTYLKIKARKTPGTQGSSGLIASVDMDGKGFWAKPPCYLECRFTAQSAPGTWPAFWTITALERGKPGDELDIIEGYGGDGKGNPNHPGYSIVSHFWGQNDKNGNKKKEYDRVVPMMELGGKSYWSTTFHTYAVRIGLEETVYYFDNLEVLRHPTNDVSLHPHLFLINYAIGGISGWPIDLERYGNGSDMYVDYVRVYAGEAAKN